MWLARVWRLLEAALAVGSWAVAGLSLTEVRSTESYCQTDARYFWASGRGNAGQYSKASYKGAWDLASKLAWKWHDPRGQFFTSPTGIAVDDKYGIYVTALDGVRKLNREGTLVWQWTREEGEELPDAASLHNGKLFVSTTRGRIVALDMESGKEIWIHKLNDVDANNGWVMAAHGMVITGSDAVGTTRGQKICCGSGDSKIRGLDAATGEPRWEFEPDVPVWNFVASFAGDNDCGSGSKEGTFTFQDIEGRAYRVGTYNGTLIWKSGGRLGTWTDGGAVLGPNGIVYTVNTHMNTPSIPAVSPGNINAFRFSDGKLLWSVNTTEVPNNVPAVGRIAGREGLSLVQPMGQQMAPLAPTAVKAYDAETGALQWSFVGPRQMGLLQAGDRNLLAVFQRSQAKLRPITLPNPWSAPAIDAEGTVFVGSQEGPFFGLRDLNGDGVVAGSGEVTKFDTRSAPSGSTSPAFAPGLMLYASQDTVYAFKAPL